MGSLLDILLALGLGAALLSPLLYALGTLREMRPKRLYPLLRCQGAAGRMTSVTISVDHAPTGGPPTRQPFHVPTHESVRGNTANTHTQGEGLW